MKKLIPLLFILLAISAQAQELNVKLNVNTQKVQMPNRELVASLENSILQLFNDQKWTESNFSRNERLDCIVSIAINEMQTEGSFVAEIQISSRRPVYNSSYVTPLLNYRDTQFDFNYTLGQSLDYSNNTVRDNLVAVIAFYSYIVIGLDFDSFSINGGQAYFAKAMEIANAAQSLNAKGWEPFSGSKANRYDLAVALSDNSFKSFHTMWYNYHRLGLDEMAANASRGRIQVMQSIDELEKLYKLRPSSPLLTLFAEAKLDELLKICSQATADEKKEMRKKLLQFFPAKNNEINELK